MARARKRNKKRKQLLFKITAFTLILLILFYAVDAYFRPTVTRSLEYYAKTVTTDLIDQAISHAIEQSGYDYTDLTVVSRNAAGNVTSIEANMINIAKMQSLISEHLRTNLNTLENADLSIALGTLSGSLFLAGKGPHIDITLATGRSVQNKMQSSFNAAGINQTRHSIILTTEIDIGALIPGYTANVHISYDYIVAETIIVGTVPQYYTRIITDSEDVLNATGSYDITDIN